MSEYWGDVPWWNDVLTPMPAEITESKRLVDEFLCGKIGLIVKESSVEAVQELSDLPEMPEYDDETLISYFTECVTDDWEILVYENYKEYNAFRNESAVQFKENHKIYTADEILRDLNSETMPEVTEMEYNKIFE